jgi:hypothetical protein
MIDFSISLMFLAFLDQVGAISGVDRLNQVRVHNVANQVCSGALAQVPDGVDCAYLLAISEAMY